MLIPGDIVMSAAPQTPLMRQYQSIKQANPGALLFFRLGDFYELFFDDAVTAARELQITLTARNKEKGQPIPMCGVPYHAAENYLAKLIQKGYRVAICDQMEVPGPGKALVRREVTRVVTPGTAEPAQAPGENNYLAALARGPGHIGLALLDLSTGEFRATEFSGADAELRLAEELEQWRPREILHASSMPLFEDQPQRPPAGAVLTPLDAWVFEPDFARRELESHFGVLALEGYGLAGKPWAAAAAGALVHYSKETQRSQIEHVDRLGYYERGDALILDAVTARNLELVEPLLPGGDDVTLRAVLDQTHTAMGQRLLRQWLLRPARDLAVIEARLDAVQALRDGWAARAGLRATLDGMQDLERLLARASLRSASPRDLAALGQTLARIPELRRRLLEAAAPPAPSVPEPNSSAGLLAGIAGRLDDLAPLRERIAATLAEPAPVTLGDGRAIRAGISPELDELRTLSHDAKSVIAQLESRERARTGIASLKVRFNSVFGYSIEVTKPNLALVPDDYQRKQTLVGAERFTTPELKQYEEKILGAEEKISALEQRIFAELRAAVALAAASIRQNAQAAAETDVLACFAELAATRQYCRPRFSPEGRLELRNGRHPVVEQLGFHGSSERFVANDVSLDAAHRVVLITGPNMGGKSTYLRQTALAVLMAQMGSFVAAESALLPLVDRIFTRIGAGDNLARGRSTFMVEMAETAAILHGATRDSLILLDEIGRGTSTYDGLALAWAVLEHLHDTTGAKTLFATHYHELTELARHLPGVVNVQVMVKETPAGIVFLRQVRPGEASRSYGIEVARLAGLPAEVIARARVVLRQHESAERRASRQLEPEPPPQMALFTPLSQGILDRLRALDPERLTPLEALNLLAALKRELEEE